MKKLILTITTVLSLNAISQQQVHTGNVAPVIEAEVINMSIGFVPPLDRVILDSLEVEHGLVWERFIRVNYNLSVNGVVMDPMEIKQLLELRVIIKEQILIERKK